MSDKTVLFVAVLWGWDGFEEVQIFSSKEKAQDYIDKQRWNSDNWGIEEMILDEEGI